MRQKYLVMDCIREEFQENDITSFEDLPIIQNQPI
jgi:hypothetical protein